MQTTRFQIGLAAAAIACAGCAPIPIHTYVPDAPGGKLNYSTCNFNSHVPVSISIGIEDVLATVSLAKNDGREFVQVQFDIPAGKTLVLDSGTVKLDFSAPQASRRSEFPSVSLVDTPIINSYSNVQAVQQQQRPIATPLVGQRITAGALSWNKHFWLATYTDTSAAADVWVTLPSFTLNGVASRLPQIHFNRQSMIAIALLNC